MTEYLLSLKHRQVVARDAVAFWFETLGTGGLTRSFFT